MLSLVPCRRCGRHRFVSPSVCPFCGAAAVLVGASVACAPKPGADLLTSEGGGHRPPAVASQGEGDEGTPAGAPAPAEDTADHSTPQPPHRPEMIVPVYGPPPRDTVARLAPTLPPPAPLVDEDAIARLSAYEVARAARRERVSDEQAAGVIARDSFTEGLQVVQRLPALQEWQSAVRLELGRCLVDGNNRAGVPLEGAVSVTLVWDKTGYAAEVNVHPHPRAPVKLTDAETLACMREVLQWTRLQLGVPDFVSWGIEFRRPTP